MWNSICVEIYKTFAKPRTYIGALAVSVIIGLIQLGYYYNQDILGRRLSSQLGDSVDIQNISLNGNYICMMVLQLLFVHLPIIIALVSGDSISGEMSSGTIRTLLTKPISRWKIFFAKFIANQVYVILIVLLIFLHGYLISKLLFGDGDMVGFGEVISILSKDDLQWRFLSAIGLAYLSLSVISTLAFLFSSLLENSVAPVVITMVVNIVFLILGELDVPVFNPIKEFLFTEHMSLWNEFFEFQVDYHKVLHSAMILSGYIFVFLTISFFSFTRKDITQ